MGRHSSRSRVAPWLLFGVLPVVALAVMIAVVTFSRGSSRHDDAGPSGPSPSVASSGPTVADPSTPASPTPSTTGCGGIACSTSSAPSTSPRPAPTSSSRPPGPTTPVRTPTTPAPRTSSSSPSTVVLGDRCSVAGARATARNGKPAVCKRGDDHVLRWRRPG